MEVYGLVCLYCLTTFDDLKDRRVKVSEILIFGAIGIIINIVYRPNDLLSILGGVMIGVLLYLFSIISKGRIGKGDALLIMVTGLYLGFKDTLLLLWLSMVLAAIVGTIYVRKHHVKMDVELPFVPFLLIGYVVMFMVTNLGGLIVCG